MKSILQSVRLALTVLLGGLLLAGVVAADQTSDDPEMEEVLVVGRQPGPPLWQVSNGEHVLWIFPFVSPVPEGMQWDPERVARVLATCDEVLKRPDVDFSISPLVMMNPINLFRGRRLAKRITRNPDGETLAAVLSEDLFARFQAVKARYVPDDGDLERLRPMAAGTELLSRVKREEGLVSSSAVSRQLEKLIKKQRGLQRTDVQIDMRLEGSFRKLSNRLETLMDSITPEQELACFESQLRRTEQDIEAMKARANAWAQGYVSGFRDVALAGSTDDICVQLLFDSSETQTLTDLRARLHELWLENAERALASNANTFAALDIDELLLDDGLLAKLRARGYRIKEP